MEKSMDFFKDGHQYVCTVRDSKEVSILKSLAEVLLASEEKEIYHLYVGKENGVCVIFDTITPDTLLKLIKLFGNVDEPDTFLSEPQSLSNKRPNVSTMKEVSAQDLIPAVPPEETMHLPKFITENYLAQKAQSFHIDEDKKPKKEKPAKGKPIKRMSRKELISVLKSTDKDLSEFIKPKFRTGNLNTVFAIASISDLRILVSKIQ